MIKSCEKCGKTIIIGDSSKVMVGCPHYPVQPKNKPDLPEGFDSLFKGFK